MSGLRKAAIAVGASLAAGLLGSAAMAADLGGDCCADLEERVAELEATAVRKGNRKVSLKISGYVQAQVLWWDDGTQNDVYYGIGNGINTSRFRFTGEAKINPQLSAGFIYEFGASSALSNAVNQGNGGDDLGTSGNCPGGSTAGCAGLRKAVVYLEHKQLGKVAIGQGSTSTDDIILIDLGEKGLASSADTALVQGGFVLRGRNGQFAGTNWTAAIRGHEAFDTDRRNNILYETPTLFGFSVQAAVAEDNYWDVALRYAGEIGRFRLAGGIGYQEDTEFNAPAGGITAGAASVVCTSNCDVKSSEVKGSAAILHVDTGLFLTGAAGIRELTGSNGAGLAGRNYAGPDLTWWYLAGGISKNFFGIGKTVLYGEYIQSRGGLEQVSFLANGANGYLANTAATGRSNSEVQQWGVGVTQYVDAAALELFVSYKNYSLDASGFVSTPNLNASGSGVADISVVIAGTRINF